MVKTVIFIANFTENNQFKPMISIPREPVMIETVQETKLLGYFLTADMKPGRQVQHITSIAYKRIWALNRMKAIGIHNRDIIHFFNIKIHSVLESSAVVFHSMLTEEDKDDIERLQVILVKICLGKKYTNYKNGLQQLSLISLESRRHVLCLKWGLSCLKSARFSNWFVPSPYTNICPQTRETFVLPFAVTKLYNESPTVVFVT